MDDEQEPKRKRGRPKLKPGEHTVSIGFRLAPDVAEGLRFLANASKKSQSDIISECVRDRMKWARVAKSEPIS
jgi:hypothetical protein